MRRGRHAAQGEQNDVPIPHYTIKIYSKHNAAVTIKAADNWQTQLERIERVLFFLEKNKKGNEQRSLRKKIKTTSRGERERQNGEELRSSERQGRFWFFFFFFLLFTFQSTFPLVKDRSARLAEKKV